MISKWAQRFYENIDPRPRDMGFDGLGNLETKTENKVKINNECSKEDKECMRLGFRMDELKDRISRHAEIPATLPSYRAWNKNPQCPPDTWKDMSVPIVPKSTKIFKGLAVQRHSQFENTLDNINPIELSFSINNDIDLGDGFWLIKGKYQYENFVYAILKSSMFRAWCELTAYTEGQGHFTVGMWDTFPLPNLTCSQRGKIITAGRELQKGRKDSQKKLDKLIDGLFTSPDSTHILSDKCRIRILAQGFLDAFYGA